MMSFKQRKLEKERIRQEKLEAERKEREIQAKINIKRTLSGMKNQSQKLERFSIIDIGGKDNKEKYYKIITKRKRRKENDKTRTITENSKQGKFYQKILWRIRGKMEKWNRWQALILYIVLRYNRGIRTTKRFERM